jgi:hypothetical protein
LRGNFIKTEPFEARWRHILHYEFKFLAHSSADWEKTLTKE